MAGVTCPDSNEKQDQKAETGSSECIEEDSSENITVSTSSAASGDHEDENKEKEEERKDENGVTEKNDVIMVHDIGFPIKIQPPGMEPFEIQVSSMELVQELHQVLMDQVDTCHRTCFSLQLDGVVLDKFCELKTIDGLKEGSLVKVVEDPYTVRESRLHLRHIRDLLRSVDPSDSYNGDEFSSLSFLNTVTAGDILTDKKRGKPDALDCTPPDYIMPDSKDRPIQPLHPGLKEQWGPKCLRVLTYSGWNPPPACRRLKGDLMYLYIVTLEDKNYHITASPMGFYVNQSADNEFNPKPAIQKHLSHALVDLLNQISPAFKRYFATLLKKRTQKHPFERVATPYQVYSWLAPPLEHSVDYMRASDAFSNRIGYEEQIPGQTRDWNEELQTTRELPRHTLPERLIRERAIFKSHSDFVSAAVRGAMAVIDGNVMPINPGEDSKMQMFIWSNIFFSLGFDVKEHYKEFGGDAAAYTAPASDLQGVRAYASLDLEGLYTLGTVVVDYRGFRVTAQSIIPGILEREQEQSVVYGSVDFGKTVVTCEKYQELLKKSAVQLKIKPHKVVNDKGEEILLYSSVDCKGIIGNDKRYYILDLLRTFPPDINFLPDAENEIEFSQELKKLGFPQKHKHKLVCLRQELMEAFLETKYMDFVRYAAAEFQQLRLKKQQKAEESGHDTSEKDIKVLEEKMNKIASEQSNGQTVDSHKILQALTDSEGESVENSTRDIVRRATKHVGSSSDIEFDIIFNPDVFQPMVKHADAEGELLKSEKSLVKEAAEFLVLQQIPNFISECLTHTSAPIDGYTLVEAMHNKGINVRYLGKIAEMLTHYPQLSYILSIAVGEMLCRSGKHLFQLQMHRVEPMSTSAAICHFLNCLLGSFQQPHVQVVADEFSGKNIKKKNKKKSKGFLGSIHDNDWVSETPRSVWKQLVEDIKGHYDFTLECDSMDSTVELYGFQKISLLRSICMKIGVQILLREYNMDNKLKQTFYEEDILNTFPLVKHINTKATDAYQFFTSGQAKIQQGHIREGYELIHESLSLLNNVYGAMHPEIAACLRLLARLSYVFGDYSDALSVQQRAVLMSERVLGIDHPNTITEYAHLALYCFANNQISSSLRLLYRARYLALLCHGEHHPEVALFDSNIGLILHAVGEYELSLRFLNKALALNKEFYGAKSLKVAMGFHLVARALSCQGDFRQALQNEKEAFTIYKEQLGEDSERTKDSSECLKHLTQQAVYLQKTMNEITKGEKNVFLPPLQIAKPSMNTILDTLNVINGIELVQFVQLSPEAIEKLRQEINKKNKSTSPSLSQEDVSAQMKDIKDEVGTINGLTEDSSTSTSGSSSGDEKESKPANTDKVLNGPCSPVREKMASFGLD